MLSTTETAGEFYVLTQITKVLMITSTNVLSPAEHPIMLSVWYAFLISLNLVMARALPTYLHPNTQHSFEGLFIIEFWTCVVVVIVTMVR